ncbi:MAG: ATP-binding cassette domain-containing protein [Flavobacteriales bacterium]|nr:ATP-binding cassette domain-containing protein [Flavobacteriales bacterium]
MSRTGDSTKRPIKKEHLLRARSILVYLRPYKGLFGLGMLLLLFSSITTLLVPRLMGQLAGIGLSDESATSFFEIADMQLDLMDMRTVAVLLFIVFMAQGLISFLKVYVFSYVSEHMIKDLRQDLFSHILRLPMTYFSDQRVGELNSRISTDIATIQETFTTTLAEFIRQLIVIILGLAFLFYISTELALVMLATLPVMMVVAVFFGRFVRRLSKRTQDLVAESNVIVQESLTGIINVKSFTNEWFEIERYSDRIDDVKKIAIKTSIWRGIFAAFIIIFLFGSIAIVMGVGSMLIEQGLEPGLFISFLLYTVMIGASFGGFASQYSAIQKALGAIESVLDILEEDAEPVSVAKPQENEREEHISGSITFSEVDFHYPSRPDVQVLREVSFHVHPGEQVALVGPSGAGKSTIASLIQGFYTPSTGSITIDGRPFESYDLSFLREQMAYVPQEVLLFGGTVKENIQYGRPGASDEAIHAAAEKAQALEFIDRFDQGMETLVGDRGIQLSGGQKQRIAIARALLKDPRILILDEATSSLDSSSEVLVQRALVNLMKGRTSVVIAHRLSTIRGADKILVMHGGRIVEAGDHDELIAREDGLYAELNRLQDQSQDLLV